MKIYVDKHELVVIEADGKFAVIDPHEDFDRAVFVADVAEGEYDPYTDLEDDGDVLVYESKPEKTFPVRYNDTIVGEARYNEVAGTINIAVTDERVIEYLSLNNPADGVAVSL